MSGIVGSYHNIRGSGVVNKLGTDGQVFTSTGVGGAAGFEDAAGGGKLLQAVGTSKTDITSYSNDGVWADLGISLAITPTKASSKIMIMGAVNFYVGGFAAFKVVIDVDGGGYGDITGAIGDVRGSRTRALASLNRTAHVTSSLTFLDSPSYTLTDELTYKIQWMTDGSTALLNYGLADTNNDGYGSNATTFNLMEIGA
jgi:hypothetical protein